MCQLLVQRESWRYLRLINYKHLGSCSVDSAFDDSWKEEVDEQVSECSSVSKACEDRVYIG